jgi:hypothetical protein
MGVDVLDLSPPPPESSPAVGGRNYFFAQLGFNNDAFYHRLSPFTYPSGEHGWPQEFLLYRFHILRKVPFGRLHY